MNANSESSKTLIVSLIKQPGAEGTQEESATIVSAEKLEELVKKFGITHDVFFVLMFQEKEIAIEYLRTFLSPETLSQIDLERLIIEVRVFHDEFFRELRADMIYRVPLKDSDNEISAYILMEHKSYSDPNVLFQSLKYMVRIMDQGRGKTGKYPRILPFVLYNGKEDYPDGFENFSNQIDSYNFPGFEPLNFTACFVNLNKRNLSKLTNVPRLFYVLKAMSLIYDKDIENQGIALVKGINKNFQGEDRDEFLKRVVAYFLKSASELSADGVIKINNNAKSTKGEINMPSVADTWMAEGYKKGVEQGQINMLKKLIVQNLQKRFGNLPSEINEKIIAMSDVTALESLYNTVESCTSLDDFCSDLF